MLNLLQEIKDGWLIRISENPAEYVHFEHPQFGELKIGQRSDGHMGWTFHEPGGGGSVIVPYTILKGTLFVGLLKEYRPLRGGVTLNVPRGFLGGCKPLEAAWREQDEEVGFIDGTIRIGQLPGNPANPNSAFFETRAGEGVHFFAFMLHANELEEITEECVEGAEGKVFAIKRNLMSPTAEEANILDVRFYKWTVAAKVGDMFTNAAVARLLAMLKEQ